VIFSACRRQAPFKLQLADPSRTVGASSRWAEMCHSTTGSSQPIRSPRRCGALNCGGNSSDAAPCA
jgi:hypothetical protein